MTLIAPVATAAATTAGLWFIPLLVATISFYQYDKKDPEGRPYDVKVCKRKQFFLLYSNFLLKCLLASFVLCLTGHSQIL
jgi:hypothetical protein